MNILVYDLVWQYDIIYLPQNKLDSARVNSVVRRSGGRKTSKMWNNEGEEEDEYRIRKATFGSANACVRVRGKIF
ncbi:hypothetical protein J6590_100438 [Homalodisca vitripennis]|nr:hypothetical protein J6590_100438 [Homalodisca vitripennis]